MGIFGLSLGAVLSLLLALRAPLTTTAVALMVFGLLHNVLELRYVGGRFAGLLSGRLLRLLLALITGIVLIRTAGLLLGASFSVRAEIVLTYAIIAVAAWYGLGRWRWAAAPVLALAAATSLTWPSAHVVVITHLHNLIPLVFLAEFAGSFPPRARRAFMAVQIGWVLVLPALILAGLFDRWAAGTAATVGRFAAIPQVVAAGVTPNGSWGTTIGVRFLTVFAFLQLLHFLVWIFYLPRYAPDATAAFEHRMPWFTGRRVWALGLGAGALLLLLFLFDYGQGRSVYSALASYHAYLELPVMLAVLLSWPQARKSGDRRVPAAHAAVAAGRTA